MNERSAFRIRVSLFLGAAAGLLAVSVVTYQAVHTLDVPDVVERERDGGSNLSKSSGLCI